MKKSKLSDAQIVSMLNENAAGTTVVELCRKYSIAKSRWIKDTIATNCNLSC